MIRSEVFEDLLRGGWRSLEFGPFRDGIEICRLTEGPGPVWAVLRYQPGARVPEHLHPALETLLVLEGRQSDESGTYGAGTMVLNPPGSTHSVRSDEGCVVLIQWQAPVRIL